jgi:hypothetical protein
MAGETGFRQNRVNRSGQKVQNPDDYYATATRRTELCGDVVFICAGSILQIEPDIFILQRSLQQFL